MTSDASLESAVRARLQGSVNFVRTHSRGLAASVAVALAGCAATAYGIATQAPDAADLPRRLVTEIVVPDDITSQLEALAEHELELYRSDLTRSTDTADSLLRRLGVDDSGAVTFLRTDLIARRLLEGRPGKMVRVSTDETGQVTELVARYAAMDPKQASTHFTRLRVERIGGKLFSTLETGALATQVRLGSGSIRTSLFAATDESRIPDAVASQLAEVFSTDIDFRTDLRRGDSFSVLYEALTADGEPITWGSDTGRLLAAEFVNAGKTLQAVWFQDGSSKGSYYDFDGRSKRRAFLASPLEFSRVTSGFAMRLHPILNQWRAHKGVDYGAPTGTAVRAVGDGVVDFAGWQNGYGNVVEIRHNSERTTVYAHLSRIDVRKGQRIDQGSTIGAVGMTGWATGPHLHFEVKVRGEQQNPLSFAKASEAVELDPAARQRFLSAAQSLRGELQAAATLRGGAGYGE